MRRGPHPFRTTQTGSQGGTGTEERGTPAGARRLCRRSHIHIYTCNRYLQMRSLASASSMPRLAAVASRWVSHGVSEAPATIASTASEPSANHHPHPPRDTLRENRHKHANNGRSMWTVHTPHMGWPPQAHTITHHAIQHHPHATQNIPTRPAATEASPLASPHAAAPTTPPSHQSNIKRRGQRSTHPRPRKVVRRVRRHVQPEQLL